MRAEHEIRDLLETYERSLCTSDVALAVACYTRDGIVMPTMLATAKGAALEVAYAGTFKAIRLNVTFTIDELTVESDAVAYALTRRNGVQTILATGAKNTEANREPFIFGREAGAWKIRRYLFDKPQS